MTVKIDQIADAVISAPGVRIEISDGQPVTAIPIGATDTKIMPELSSSMAFTVPIAAKYAVQFGLEVVAASTSTSSQFKLVFDEGTGDEQTVGYTDRWQGRVTAAGDYGFFTFVDEIEFAAGSHTVTAYAKEVSGTGMSIPGSSGEPASAPVLELTAVTGSGAGGVLVSSSVLSADFSEAVVSNVLEDIPNLDPITFTVAEGEYVQVNWSGTICGDSSSVDTMAVMNLDGTDLMGVYHSESYCKNLSFSRVVGPLSAGSHTIKMRMGCSSTETLTGSVIYGATGIETTPRFDVIRFRGGLVPIQFNGEEIVGQPRALNFIGGGVYEVTEGYGTNTGVAQIELNQAITALGSSIITDPVSYPSSVSPTASYAILDDGGGNTSEFTVEIPSTGTYRIQLVQTFWTSASNLVDFRLNIDSGAKYAGASTGGATPPGTPADSTWRLRGDAASIRIWPSLVAEVELTAGQHTIDVEWAYATGSSGTSLNQYDRTRLVLDLISGSGAGGVLVSSSVLSADFSEAVVSNVLEDIPNLDPITVDTSEGEYVQVCWAGTLRLSTALSSDIFAIINVDGVDLTGVYHSQPNSKNLSFSRMIGPLSAGSHVFKMRMGCYHAATIIGDVGYYLDSSIKTTPRFDVIRFRGGLVPVRKDGQTIIDKPAAVDYVGPNVQVTNVGGTAKVNFNGATGTVIDLRYFSYYYDAPTTGAAPYTAGVRMFFMKTGVMQGIQFRTAQTAARTFRGKLWNNTTEVASGLLSTNAAGLYELYFDTPYEITESMIGDTFYISLYEITVGDYARQSGNPPGAEEPTKIGRAWACYDGVPHHYRAGDDSVYPSATASVGRHPMDPIYEIEADPAGFVQPENVPIISSVDGYLYQYVSAPGAANELRITMNDGVRYKANSAIQMDLDSTGLGGRETSANLVSGTWYYNYAVSDSSNTGYFGIIASDQHPGLGPIDYTIWRYLGAVYYINSADRIRKVSQVGNKFDYSDATDTTLWIYDSGNGGATEVTPIVNTWYSFSTSGVGPGGGLQRDLRDTVPVSAAQADFSAGMDTDSGEVYDLFIDSGRVLYTPTATAITAGAFISCDTSQRNSNRTLIPLYNRDAYFMWTAQNTGPISWVVNVRGYVDGYLTNLESQTQALYVPDSLLPQLIWNGISQVDIEALPTQPSVVKLTLQDEKERSFNGTLLFDPSLGMADGGLDTGSEASSTWYYLYLVPESGNDDFLTVRGSVNPPYTGPSGYSNYRYIGTIRNNSSSNIRIFHQVGDWFYSESDPADDELVLISDATATKSSWVDMSTALATAVPVAIAGATSVRAWTDGYAAQTNYFFVESGNPPGFTPSVANQGDKALSFVSTQDSSHGNNTKWVELPDGTISYYCIQDAGSGDIAIGILATAWQDGYLGQASDAGNAHYGAQNLNQAYDGGRIITVDSGPIQLNASGEEALNIDGYIGLETISDPTILANEKGFVYAKEVDGYSELFYMDDFGLTTQITKYGKLNADEFAAHASSHIFGGTDAIDGDKLDIDWNPSNYTPDTSPSEVTSVDELTAHLAGVDGYLLDLGNGIATNSSDLAAHEADTANPHATDIGNLGSGTLAELNAAVSDATLVDESVFDAYAEKVLLDSYATTSHATTHIRNGTDEIDGDKLDIDWNPSNYVPTTDPSEVTSVDELTAHLAGVDGYLATLGNAQNNHIGDETNPHIVTLDQAYDGNGGAAGRSILADNGPIFIDASGAAALEMDGYIALEEIATPDALINTSLLYSKSADGYSELFYQDINKEVRLTDQGVVNTDGYSGTVAVGGGISFVIENGLIKSVT